MFNKRATGREFGRSRITVPFPKYKRPETCSRPASPALATCGNRQLVSNVRTEIMDTAFHNWNRVVRLQKSGLDHGWTLNHSTLDVNIPESGRPPRMKGRAKPPTKQDHSFSYLFFFNLAFI